ncbi:hypothetical protein [Desulforhopalus singaporensis]|uniref:hypothetical protein n=1 Tax=Desulforhopalus singaporensis TaxID=91360 RepID=UPI000B816BF3|nr:hypothetical protein [Desulforhopalus singaporensis]
MKTELFATGSGCLTPRTGKMKRITTKMPYHVGEVHLYLTEIVSGLVLLYVFKTHGHFDHFGLARIPGKGDNC